MCLCSPRGYFFNDFASPQAESSARTRTPRPSESLDFTVCASAEASTRAAVCEMAAELPEVADFMRDFFPSYGATLDDLL